VTASEFRAGVRQSVESDSSSALAQPFFACRIRIVPIQLGEVDPAAVKCPGPRNSASTAPRRLRSRPVVLHSSRLPHPVARPSSGGLRPNLASREGFFCAVWRPARRVATIRRDHGAGLFERPVNGPQRIDVPARIRRQRFGQRSIALILRHRCPRVSVLHQGDLGVKSSIAPKWANRIRIAACTSQ